MVRTIHKDILFVVVEREILFFKLKISYFRLWFLYKSGLRNFAAEAKKTILSEYNTFQDKDF